MNSVKAAHLKRVGRSHHTKIAKDGIEKQGTITTPTSYAVLKM